MGTEKEGLTEAEFVALSAALDADLKCAQQMYAERGVYPTMELRLMIEKWRVHDVLAYITDKLATDEGKEEAMDDCNGTESYGPADSFEGETGGLGVTLYFRHTLTARGLVPQERARETSKSPGLVIVWGRGEAGSEIYYEGMHYVSEQALQREKFKIQERLDAVAAERDKLAARAWALEAALTNLCDAVTDTREKLLADVLAASRQGMAALDGRPIGSVKVVGPEGAEVESVRDGGTIAFREPPPSGSVLVSENVPRHAQDIAREYASAERIAELEAEGNDEMSRPEAWWLIARDDVQRVLDFLTGIRFGGGETIAAICDAAIHLLETGVHETEAVPADFLGGHEEASEDDDD